jgi:hypothetical protein
MGEIHVFLFSVRFGASEQPGCYLVLQNTLYHDKSQQFYKNTNNRLDEQWLKELLSPMDL